MEGRTGSSLNEALVPHEPKPVFSLVTVVMASFVSAAVAAVITVLVYPSPMLPTPAQAICAVPKPGRNFSHIPVQDTHMHLSNWSLIHYTYSHDSINYHNWTHEDYVKATAPSLLVPARFMMMGLVGVPHEEQLLQSQYIQSVADGLDSSPPMVGHVATISALLDLSGGANFSRFLDELQATAPITRGCRCSFPANFSSASVQGLRELARRNLTFDLFVDGTIATLQHAADVAAQVPELTMVLDHMGLSGIAGAVIPDFDQWSQAMRRLAALPNLYVKISGPAIGIDQLRPIFRESIEIFGYERSIYSTNWYVVESEEYFFSYRAWANAATLYLNEMSTTDEEAHWLLHRAAEKAYRLPPL